MLELEQVKPEPIASEMPVFKADPLPRPAPSKVMTRPVRAPLRVIWREVRFRLLPVAAFILAGIYAVLLWRQWILVETSLPPASSFAQEPTMIQRGTAVADKESAVVEPLESAGARN
jgi:hypothetical protein